MNAAVALALYVASLALTFGVRTWLMKRRTGTTGWRGFSGSVGSKEWWGGALFAVAVAAGGAAPVASMLGMRDVAPSSVTAGATIAVVGFAATFAAQLGMGASWRIGVDANERTALVERGAFRVVRNPIFTGMLVASVGLACIVPNVVAIAAVVALFAAVEIQVRLVEEPYLIRTHGAAYTSYAARVGRFVPGLGRLPPTT